MSEDALLSDNLASIQADVRLCTLCLEAGYEIQGPPIFSGNDVARVMIVGQAPGIVEVSETGMPFSGAAGKRLFRWLHDAGWNEEAFRAEHYITSITKCFPGPNKSGRGDRAPTRKEQQLCGDWLLAEVTLVDPDLILPIGKFAIDRFFGRGYKLVDLIGSRFQLDGRIVIPLPHPSGASAWIQQPEHRLLIQRAIEQLSLARQEVEASPGPNG